MSRKRRIPHQVFGFLSACSVGCTAALPHMPLASRVQLPMPQISAPTPHDTSIPENRTPPPFISQSPESPQTSSGAPSSSPFLSPSIQASSDPISSPSSSATPPVPSTVSVEISFPPFEQINDSTSVWVENPQSAITAIREEETAHAVFIQEAHSIIIDAGAAFDGASSVSVRVSANAPNELDLHRIRPDFYGSSDLTGRAKVARSSLIATFAAAQGGEYLLGGDETYIPPNGIDIPMEQSVQESLSFDSNSEDVSAASLGIMNRRRIASVSNVLRVKNYLQETKFRVRPVILFLHGMGEKNPKELWAHITSYLKMSASNRDQLKGTVFSIPVYNSLQAVHASMLRLKQQVLNSIGIAPIFLVCHSMGCLVARDFAADPDMKNHIVGGIMLAGANGSPWVPKKRMRRSLAGQPDATALLTAQTLALAKIMPNITESLASSKPLSSLVKSLDEGTVSKGALSLATGRDDIPTTTYAIKLRIGPYPLSFSETLSPDDTYTLPCSNNFFPQWPLDRRIRYGACYANFARELRAWERQQGLDTIPRWYAYAGYYRGNELRAARETFLRRLASNQLMTQFITDTSESVQEEGLKFAASLLADRVTKNGKAKRFSDGLVDPEDAWLEDDGASLESASSRRDDLYIDMAVAEQRRSTDVIALRAFLRSHRQIVRGLTANDAELFESIAKDLGSLLASYRSQSTAYDDSELDGVRGEIQQQYTAVEGIYSANNTRIGTKTTKAVFKDAVPCSSSALCVDLPFDIVQSSSYYTGQQIQTTVRSDSVRAYKIWRVWRLFEG